MDNDSKTRTCKSDGHWGGSILRCKQGNSLCVLKFKWFVTCLKQNMS